jgi:phage tail tape-measure protein
MRVSTNRQEEHERVGSIAGLGAGVIAGAQIGTAFIPIPIVGTFAGALVGGVLGSEVGKTVGAAILDGVQAFAESLNGPAAGQADAEKDSSPVDPNAP